MAELSLTPYCWLLFAPGIRPQHLGKIIPWSKEDREVREKRIKLWRSMLPKFPRWMSSYLGNVAPIVALADVISRGLGSLSIPLGSSYRFWQHVHVTANITGVQVHVFTFLSTLMNRSTKQSRHPHLWASLSV